MADPEISGPEAKWVADLNSRLRRSNPGLHDLITRLLAGDRPEIRPTILTDVLAGRSVGGWRSRILAAWALGRLTIPELHRGAVISDLSRAFDLREREEDFNR